MTCCRLRKTHKFWHWQADGNDTEVWVHTHECSGSDVLRTSFIGKKLVVALRAHKEAAVLERHLSVFQQVVECRQDVALRLLLFPPTV